MIRVVSWNVLADAYVRREYYPHTPPGVLDRARRRKAVAERIGAFAGAEIVCLQEVDAALFALAEDKLGDSAGRLFRKRGKGEGSAIFVRRALTVDPEWRELVFTDRSGHVALGVTFAGVTVVSTHLKWEPEGTPAAVRLGRCPLGLADRLRRLQRRARQRRRRPREGARARGRLRFSPRRVHVQRERQEEAHRLHLPLGGLRGDSGAALSGRRSHAAPQRDRAVGSSADRSPPRSAMNATLTLRVEGYDREQFVGHPSKCERADDSP